MKDIKIKYNETWGTKHSRDYYRGLSFHFAGKWCPGVHYVSDDYIIDFITINNCLLACAKSHLSLNDNKPTEFKTDSIGNVIGVVSNCWDFVCAGVKGASVGVRFNENTNELEYCEDTTAEEPEWEPIVRIPQVLQETGDSEIDTMSQNAITEELDAKADITYVDAQDALLMPKSGGTFTGKVTFAKEAIFAASPTMNHNPIHNVGTPVNNADAANKAYVDDAKSDVLSELAITDATVAQHSTRLVSIEDKIPSDASESNKLADKQYVNSGLADKQDVLSFDSVPTQNSNNPVKSGGVYTGLQGKQDKPTHYDLSNDKYLCIRLDQRASFLRLDVTYDGVGIGQFVVITTNNPSQAKVVATKEIKDKVTFQQFTYPISGGHTYLGIYHNIETQVDHTLSIDVATLSGEAPDIIDYLTTDSIGESTTTPVTFTAVSYLADNTDLALKQDTLVSGTNIKTINGTSVLGSGNIPIVNIKDYAQNDPQNDQYIRNRKGGYDETFSDESITGSGGERGGDGNYLPDVTSTSPNRGALARILQLGVIVPCTYSPSDGDLAGEELFGTLYFDEDQGDYKIIPDEEDTGTRLDYWDVYPSDIPGIIYDGEREIYRLPVQFPSEYIPHDSTKQDTLTFDNVPTQNSNNPVKSGGVYSGLKEITDLVPAQASSSNQLADKNFVNSSIQTATATFKGNWETWGDVPRNWKDYLDETRPDSNDYLVVRDASDYAPLWDDTGGYSPGDVVSVSITSSTYGLYRCIADVDYKEDPPLSPEEDTTHWEEVSSNPAYEGTWRFKYAGTWNIDGKWGWLPEYQVNEKPLTAAQLAALNSGITDTKVAKLDALPATIPTEVFVAEYGVTTASDIESAISAGKIVVCFYNSACYTFGRLETNYIYLSTTRQERYYNIAIHRTNNTWQTLSATFELSSNKVSPIDSTNYDSSTKYPSLAALNASLYKWGVISQVQTWSSSSSGATYTMSNKVEGLIPQSFIDIATSAGATFNSVSGYFELNGLTDISYEEMRAIYNMGTLPNYQDNIFLQAQARTNLPTWRRSMQSLYQCCRQSSLEVFVANPNNDLALGNNGCNSFAYSATRLSRIVGVINLSNVTGTINNFCTYSSLAEFQLKGLKANIPLASNYITKDSLLYLINNEAATGSITITLNATVYAKTQSGGEWYSDISTALSTHTSVSLASA